MSFSGRGRGRARAAELRPTARGLRFSASSASFGGQTTVDDKMMRSVSIRPASGQQLSGSTRRMIEDKQARRESVSSLSKSQQQQDASDLQQQQQQPQHQQPNQKQRRSLFSILFNPTKSASKNHSKTDAESMDKSSDREGATNHGSSEATKTTKKGKENDNDDDADSYVLDLNDRLAIEKLYKHGGSAARELVLTSNEDPATRQLHQLGQPTIEQLERRQPETTKLLGPPSMLAIRTPRIAARPRPNSFSNLPNPKPSPAKPQSYHQAAGGGSSSGRTCLLEPRFDSLGLSSADEQSDDSDLSSSTSSTSSAVSVDFSVDRRAPVKGIDISMSEQDQRLFKWRLLAARTAWAAGSPLSSDSELELLDCQSPALVVACSDDTSCSSVELIWSKPASENRRATASASASRCCTADSEQDSQNITPRVQVSATATPAAPMKVNQGFLANFSERQRSFKQKLAIFELAKPMRGKNKTTPSPSQWVANPLFANANEDDGHEFVDNNSLGVAAADNNQDSRLDVGRSISSCNGGAGGISSTRLNENEESAEEIENFGKNLGKQRRGKKRWSSIRLLKTEHYFSSSNNNNHNDDHDDDDDDNKRKSSPETGSLKQRDNIYLNHILNLDRRIKSNVSSLRSQLSETSKRASILADQLLTSIKDTTKEQLFSHNSTTARRQSTLSSTFDTSGAGADDERKTHPEQPFSLIYMHQQPVITRQPRSTGCIAASPQVDKHQSSKLSGPNPAAAGAATLSSVGPTNTKAAEEAGAAEAAAEAAAVAKVEKKEQSSQTSTTISKSTGERSRARSDMKEAKKLRRKRVRRQVNVAPPTSDEDECENESIESKNFKGKRKFRPRVRKVSRSQSLELAELGLR